MFSFQAKIQSLFNELIKQDARSADKLSALRGRVIIIHIDGPDRVVCLQFAEDGVRLLEAFEGEPHVTISATPITYLSLLMNHADGFPANMNIQGDVGVAQKFQQLLHELEIDWEELASQWTGDTAARQLGRLARAMRHYLAEVRQSTRLNISEYLLYEKEIVPEKEEIDDFIREIATLRNDSERLFQRFDRLEKQVQGSS